MNQAQWIWLDDAVYPQYQSTYCTTFAPKEGYSFCVAEFRRTFLLPKAAVRARVRVSGDTKYWLWIDDIFIGMGPVCAGGDYGNELPMPVHYASGYEFTPQGAAIDVFARVQLSPAVMTDYSCGRGGFFFECDVTYADGTRETLVSDEAWQARRNGQYASASNTDFTKSPDEWTGAKRVESVWSLKDAPIPPLSETRVTPDWPSELVVKPGESGEMTLMFDKIYSGYCALNISAAEKCTVTITPFELEGQNSGRETIVTDHPVEYRGLRMQSVGGFTVRLENQGGQAAAVLEPSLIFTCYPVADEGRFECSDAALNKVWDVCKWTLQICRQSLHLDSPRHQETLGCTGDYYVESLMTYFTFGDTRLVRLDVVRTADWLRLSKGFMFHTTYSMIWIQMLHDCYQFTGDEALLFETRDALHTLLDRFNGYLGESGLIETPPSWMFVDWIVADALSMHHPPKALGQTTLCAFYHRALNTAARLCDVMGDSERATLYRDRAGKLKAAVNAQLFDEAKGLYFDGLNTPQGKSALPIIEGAANPAPFMPENVDKRFYSTQSNTMAVLSGLCEGDAARSIMRRVMEDATLIPFQPYYAHFVLDALHACGLFAEYGLALMGRWKDMVATCDKGLQEGWIAPGENYGFDHSHAWGGTPAYQLPCRLLGFEMLEPGFRKIALSPSLMGLDWAEIEMPTPYGPLRCIMRGDHIELTKPDEIDVAFN